LELISFLLGHLLLKWI